MAFEQDPCLVRTTAGELVARGFVREHDGDTLVVETPTDTGAWLEPGEGAVVEVLSPHRGTLTYDAVVEYNEGRRLGVVDLRLRAVVQHRQAVRVPTALPVRITHRVEGRERPELEEPVDALVIDVSAHGMRLRTEADLADGLHLAVRFTPTNPPLDLELEVLRREELGAGYAYGCRLVGATERQTDALFRFVLDEQRRALAQRASSSGSA